VNVTVNVDAGGLLDGLREVGKSRSSITVKRDGAGRMIGADVEGASVADIKRPEA